MSSLLIAGSGLLVALGDVGGGIVAGIISVAPGILSLQENNRP